MEGLSSPFHAADDQELLTRLKVDPEHGLTEQNVTERRQQHGDTLIGFGRPCPIPLLPLQILFLNVVTDVFPALALGVGHGGKDVMKLPPRDPQEQPYLFSVRC